MIVIHPYQPTWPAEFQALRARLAQALGGRARHIAHIGSTAVPGLGAKDIIDIQVGVDRLEPALTASLCEAGCEFVARHALDHVPEGAEALQEAWSKLYFRTLPPLRPAHIHVRVVGSANHRYALLFRDYLRHHPGQRQTIERVKRELARLHGDDSDAYYAIKDPVYDLVWRAAEDWARATDWSIEQAFES